MGGFIQQAGLRTGSFGMGGPGTSTRSRVTFSPSRMANISRFSVFTFSVPTGHFGSVPVCRLFDDVTPLWESSGSGFRQIIPRNGSCPVGRRDAGSISGVSGQGSRVLCSVFGADVSRCDVVTM